MSSNNEGVAIGNEMGFLWDDQQNQFSVSWANLSNTNNSSENSGEEDKLLVGENQNMGSDGGPKGNYEKAGEGPASHNKKRSRGGDCNDNNKGVERRGKKSKNNKGKRIGGSGESDHEIHIWTERERRKKMRNMFSNLHALLPQLPPKADKSTIVDEAVTYIKTLEQTHEELKKKKLGKLHGLVMSNSTSTTTNSNGFACDPSSSLTSSPSSLSSMLVNPQQQNKISPNHCNNNDTITREAFLADQLGHTNNPITSFPSSQNAHINNNIPVAFQTWTSSNVVLNISGNEAHISVCSPKKPGLFSSICYVLDKNKIALVSAQLSSDGVRNMYMIHAHANTSGNSDQFPEAFNSVEEIFKQAVGEIMFWISS